MKRNQWFKIGSIGLLALITLLSSSSFVRPAQAASVAAGRYWAGCGNFTIDLAVTGSKDDGGGQDAIRYEVQDGNGRVLYREDASVPVGQTVGSLVIDQFYQNFAAPQANPVWFFVTDIDPSGNREILRMPSQAPCISQSGPGGGSPFPPVTGASGTMIADTRIYQYPGLYPIQNLVVRTGEGKNVLYRTPDGSWVAVYVGGGELVWVPKSTIAVDLSQLTIPPTRIHRSGLTPGQNEANRVPGQPSLLGPRAGGYSYSGPSGVAPTGAVTRGTLYLRAQPLSSGAPLDTIPAGTALSLIGRDRSGAWLKVSYNGKQGWVARFYVNIGAGDVRNLPIVQ